jgi:hypothetical protein
MNVLTIVGVRPQFIKSAPVSSFLRTDAVKTVQPMLANTAATLCAAPVPATLRSDATAGFHQHDEFVPARVHKCVS